MGSGSKDQSVDVLVGIPRGSRQEYELDQKSGRIRLDRMLFSSVHCPTDHGVIVDTLGGDGDRLDTLVVEEPTFPGCIVPARPIGTLFISDERILAVPVGDPRFDGVRGLRGLAKRWLREIETFSATHTELAGRKPTELKGWHDADVAWRLIADARSHAVASR